jgi:hypothetical protein
MPKKEFKGRLERLEGAGTWIYVDIPFDVEKTFGANGQVKVKGTVNGVSFRSSIMPHGDGSYFLVVNKSSRIAAKTEVGGSVKVVIEEDGAPRTIEAPPDLKKAFAGHPTAKAVWDQGSFSQKKEYVDWITDAKKEETRMRRVAQTIEKLAGKPPLKS